MHNKFISEFHYLPLKNVSLPLFQINNPEALVCIGDGLLHTNEVTPC